MNIVILPITEIKPYGKNPRLNDSAVNAVAASIQKFGFLVPIVIDSKHVIVAGDTRYKAAKQLRLKEVPCIDASDLSDEQVCAFRLADNKTHELSEWDMILLNDELDSIIDFDMSIFGFDATTTDFEDKNKEIDLTTKDDNYTIKLNFSETEYSELIDHLRNINLQPEKIFYDAVMDYNA